MTNIKKVKKKYPNLNILKAFKKQVLNDINIFHELELFN